MPSNPYQDLPENRFWRTGVHQSDPADMPCIHEASIILEKSDTIVTMGSCFAQHIANWLRDRGFNVPYYDATDNIRGKSFSANYGNIYTVRQAVQLLREVQGTHTPDEQAWPTDGGFVDPMRPAQFLTAFDSPEDVARSRRTHLNAVRKAIQELDVLVFTLGLTEAWRIRSCGTVLPTAPGIVAGHFDDTRYEFVNFRYGDVLSDLEALYREIRTIRRERDFRIVLTVSPVPLTATASGEHILCASTYSKSVLRAAAGDFSSDQKFCEYFPSFELITNPAAKSEQFENNLRSVRPSAVAAVMTMFERLYIPESGKGVATSAGVGDVDCEEALLDAFAAQDHGTTKSEETPLLFVGNSHLSSVKEMATPNPLGQSARFAPLNFLSHDPFAAVRRDRFRRFEFKKDGPGTFSDFTCENARSLILVGCGFMGDGIVRAHGELRAGGRGVDGRDISPNLPIVHEVTPELVAFYRPAVRNIVLKAREIEKFCNFENIFWIAGPDMTEGTARFRLGDEFVDSGSYNVHKSAYARAFETVLGKRPSAVRFATHSPDMSTQSGFTFDRFRAAANPWDIHCAPNFYQRACDQIWQTLASQASIGSALTHAPFPAESDKNDPSRMRSPTWGKRLTSVMTAMRAPLKF